MTKCNPFCFLTFFFLFWSYADDKRQKGRKKELRAAGQNSSDPACLFVLGIDFLVIFSPLLLYILDHQPAQSQRQKYPFAYIYLSKVISGQLINERSAAALSALTLSL